MWFIKIVTLFLTFALHCPIMFGSSSFIYYFRSILLPGFPPTLLRTPRTIYLWPHHRVFGLNYWPDSKFLPLFIRNSKIEESETDHLVKIYRSDFNRFVHFFAVNSDVKPWESNYGKSSAYSCKINAFISL